MNRLTALPAILFVVTAGLAQQPTPPRGSTQVPDPQAAAPAPMQDAESKPIFEPPAPSYANTAEGLERMMVDMIAMQKRNETASLAPYLRSLILPDAQAWFSARFGDAKCSEPKFSAAECLGPRQALSYEGVASSLPDSFALTLGDLIHEGLMNFEAVDYSEQCAGPMRIVANQKLTHTLSTSVLLPGLQQRHEPIYALWSYSETKEAVLAFFVYSAGAFRYVGILHEAYVEEYQKRRASGSALAQQPTPARYLSEDQMEMNPVVIDPEVVQRGVVIMLNLTKDGKVKDASYIRGPAALQDAAIAIAKKQRFDAPEFHPYGFRPNRVCFSAVVPK
jgi:hypothetical protein